MLHILLALLVQKIGNWAALFIANQESLKVFSDRLSNYILKCLLIRTCNRNYQVCAALNSVL